MPTRRIRPPCAVGRLWRHGKHFASFARRRAWYHRCSSVRRYNRHADRRSIAGIRYRVCILELRLARPDDSGQQPRCLRSGRRRCARSELRLVRSNAIDRRRLDDQRLAVQRQRRHQLQHWHAPDLYFRATMRWRDDAAKLLSRGCNIGQRGNPGRHMERRRDHDGLQGTYGGNQGLLR